MAHSELHWRDVTRAQPCPVCRGTSWCAVLENGTVACRRVEGGKHKQDANGDDYWVYFPDGYEPPREFTPPPTVPRTDADTLHEVYSYLLGRLALSQRHKDALLARGLSPDQLKHAQYRTMPAEGRAGLARELAERFGETTCAAVPGWYVKEGDDGKHFPSLAGAAGILIPLRDLAGRIVGLTVRADQPSDDCPKYTAISSRKHGGPGPGSQLHMPLWASEDAPAVVRITEGALKADIATARSRVLTLGLPGVAARRGLLAALESLKPQRVLLALDADAGRNLHVARSLRAMLAELTDAGYSVAVEVWDEADGKGIDDLLQAGKQPQVLTGTIAQNAVAGILDAATKAEARRRADGAPFGEGSATDPLADLKPALTELLARAESDKGAPFEPESKRLLARLKGMDEAEYMRALESLKASKVPLTKLERSIAGAEKDLRRENLEQAKAAGKDQPDAALEIDAGNRDLPEVTKQAWSALVAYNTGPTLYLVGNQISRLRHSQEGHLYTEMLSKDTMRWEMSNAANWYLWKAVGQDLFKEPEFPPIEAVSAVLSVSRPPLPALGGIVMAPIFGRDGTLLTVPGYHPASETYYEPIPGQIVPDVCDRPSSEAVKQAFNLLLIELLGDFPFVGEAERAHAVAGMLLPFVRMLIDGPTPLHLIEKPSAGTGAGLLVEMMTLPAMHRSIGLMTEGRDDDEWRKRLTAALMEARQAILIDNIRCRIDSAPLAAVLTSNIYEDRILGSSAMCHVPVRCLWLATGNNPVLSHEIARRTIRIRIDRRKEQPWTMKPEEFRHPDLRCWGLAHRGELIWAALTLIRHWIAEGQPRFTTLRLGTYENWSEVMGGILGAAGIPGFLENLQEFYQDSNAESDMWQSLVQAWWEKHGGAEVKSGDLLAAALELDPPFYLSAKAEHAQKTELGNKLRAVRERRFTLGKEGEEPFEVVLKHLGKKHNAQHYQLVPITRGEANLPRLTQTSLAFSPSPGTEGEVGEVGEVFSNPAYAGDVKNTPTTDDTFFNSHARGDQANPSPTSPTSPMANWSDEGPDDNEDDLSSLFPDLDLPAEDPDSHPAHWYE